MFLNYAGNHMLHYIMTVLKRRVFYPSHKVVSIQLLSSGECLITAQKKTCKIKKNEKSITFIDEE